MKKTILILLLAGLIFVLNQNISFANVYTFSPNPSDLYDLTHQSYYTWGINWTPQPNEIITRARLVIKDINNWTPEDDDALYIHLLRNAPLGVRTYTDNQGGGDNFEDWSVSNILLDIYSDSDDYPGAAENYHYRFTRNDLRHLNRWFKNGRIGFGFDPDCHYWNDGVKFRFETQVIPEPATMSLLGLGLLGILGLKKKRA